MSSCRLSLKVVPGASRTEIVGWLGDSRKVKVAAPPKKGKANKAVEAIISDTLGLANGAARIVKGSTSQQKVIEIKGLSQAEVRSLISALTA